MIALKKKLLFKKFMLLILLLGLSKLANAQDEMCNPDFEAYCDEDIDVPLDSGVCFLIIAGIIIGVRKIKSAQTANFSEQ